MQAWVEKAQIHLDKPKKVLPVLVQEEAWSYDSSSALLLLLEELARTSAILLRTKKKSLLRGSRAGDRQTYMERMCNWSELHVTPAHSQGVGSECCQFSRLPQGSCRCIPNSSKACPEISWPVPTKCFPNRKTKKRKNNTMIRSICPVIGRHQTASENFLSGQHIARSSIMNVQWFLLHWATRKQLIRRSSAAGHTPSSLRASLGWAPREEHDSSTFRKKMMIHICRPCIWRQEYAAMNILTVGVLMITACFQYEASDQLQRIGPQRVQLLCCMRFHSKAWSGTCTGDDKNIKLFLFFLFCCCYSSSAWIRSPAFKARSGKPILDVFYHLVLLHQLLLDCRVRIQQPNENHHMRHSWGRVMQQRFFVLSTS